MADLQGLVVPAAPAEVRETHSAVVVLVGDRAYKMKKPVNLGFLDFSTLEQRLQACRRELRLNRRIAPDVYLGLADVTTSEGPPCEHLLVMRRMPDDRRLSTLVAAGADVAAGLRRLARTMAAFHATARTNAEIARCGSPAALTSRWRENIARLSGLGLPERETTLLTDLSAEFIAGRTRLLEARMSAGRIRDGHGDLLADDVFLLPDGPRAIDCLDFDDRLRWMDVLDDVACLAMDLEHLGAPEAAARFLRDYAEFSGAPYPDSLGHHYVAYRAVMRAKVAAIQARQQTEDASIGMPDSSRSLVGLGLAHLTRGQVRLVLVGGGPASGKTTLAAALADASGLVVLPSDRVRKEMLGLDPLAHYPAGPGQGIYARGVTDETYRQLAHRAGALLGLGESVVVDATFSARRHRDLFRQVAATTHSALTELSCRAPDIVVQQRLHRREAVPDRYSDAVAQVAASVRGAADPWPEAIEIDTGQDRAVSLRHAMGAAGLAPSVENG